MEMTSVEVIKLEGAALDWAVLKTLDLDPVVNEYGNVFVHKSGFGIGCFEPSKDWSCGGSMIEKHCTKLERWEENNLWAAKCSPVEVAVTGRTALIAGCRAIVANCRNYIDVPSSLIEAA